MTDLELSRRLQALEGCFRRIKILAVIACIVIAALALMGQAPSPLRRIGPGTRPLDPLPEQVQTRQSVETEVRARHIILVDDKGTERASLVSDNAGSVFLVMSDRAGKARVNLSVSNDGPTLTFFDPSGQARTILGSTTAVPSHIYDNGIVELAPPSSIVFFDSKGKLLFRTPQGWRITHVEIADADYVREVTGFVIGGVPPVGHRVRIRTVLDPDLMKFDVIWAAAGTPRAVFQLTPQGRRHSDFDSNALTVTFNATFNKTFFVTLTTILALFSLAEIWLLRVPH